MAHHKHHDEKKHDKHHDDKKHEKKKHEKYKEDKRVPPTVGGPSPEGRKKAEINWLKHSGKKLTHRQKEYVKHEKKKAKKALGSDTSSMKIPSGKKYTRLQRFPTLSPQQKGILHEWGKPQEVEKFHEPKMMKRGLEALEEGIQEGPPVSPIERHARNLIEHGMNEGPEISPTESRANEMIRQGMIAGPGTAPVEASGSSFLQRLLAPDAPQAMTKDFEAPLMRQFYEEIMPNLAERYAGRDALSSSGFQTTMANAGKGLEEQLGSIKANLINQILGQQLQGANVGLGYAQMPEQRFNAKMQAGNLGLGYSQLPISRFGERLQAGNLGLGYAQLPGQRWQQRMGVAQAGIPASLIPLQTQQEMNRYATNADFMRQQQIMGTQPWGYMGVPPRGKSPGFWQQALPRIGGAIQGGMAGFAMGGPAGAAAGALAGGLGAAPPPISVNMAAQPIGAAPAPAVQRMNLGGMNALGGV
jgi:hypothetical protein